MMLKKIIIAMICVLTVVALSVFACFGWTVIRAELLGVEYGQAGDASYKVARYILSSGGGDGYQFGIYSDTILASVTRLRIYFFVDTDSLSSFYIRFSNNTLPYSSSKGNVYAATYTASGSITGSTNITSSVTHNHNQADGVSYWEWLYNGSTLSDKNILLLYLSFDNAVFSSAPAWFNILDFSVNGVPISDVKAYSNYDLLNQVSEAMDLGLVPDPSSIVTSTNNVVGYYSDLGPVMLDTYMNANVIAPMLMITFTVGAAAYILFGKKA